MSNNKYVLLIALIIFIFPGCSFMNKIGHKIVDATEGRMHTAREAREDQSINNDQSQDIQAPQEVQNTQTPKEKIKNKQKKAESNLISASNLTDAEIDELWSVAIDTCYNMKYSVTFNDRKTKNLACQMEDGGTYTARVKFTNEGILVDVSSPSMAEWVSGGFGQKRDRKILRTALESKLAELRSTSPAETADPEIIQVQKALKAVGYDPGPADGMMGSKTINALNQYQQDNDLPVTGLADTVTKNTLFRQSERPHTTSTIQHPQTRQQIENPDAPAPRQEETPSAPRQDSPDNQVSSPLDI
jgi:membrane-associated HD superfamily phosphohydrolase